MPIRPELRSLYPPNNDEDNLVALCQACHNRYDGPKRAANRKRYQRWDQERVGQMQLI